MSEWQCGDVALVTWPNSTEHVALVRTREQATGRLEFAYASGGYDMVDDDDSPGFTARPLVVIDPADAEQMRALGNAWDDLADKHAELTDVPMTLSALRMQAALREFAAPTPPKPDEPLGLGAVVEDNEGVLWVRTEPSDSDVVAWTPSWTGRTDDRQPCDYVDLLVNRVLSEGVSA